MQTHETKCLLHQIKQFTNNFLEFPKPRKLRLYNELICYSKYKNSVLFRSIKTQSIRCLTITDHFYCNTIYITRSAVSIRWKIYLIEAEQSRSQTEHRINNPTFPIHYLQG